MRRTCYYEVQKTLGIKREEKYGGFNKSVFKLHSSLNHDILMKLTC